MEIKHDKAYLYLWQHWHELDLADEVISKITVKGNNTESAKTKIKSLLELLESNFKMYQYNKNNGVNFGQEELFYRSDGSEFYFEVTIKGDTLKEHNDVADRAIDVIKTQLNNLPFIVDFYCGYKKNWEKINQYIKQDFTKENIPLQIISLFYRHIDDCTFEYTKESKDKLIQLSNMFLGQYVDRKVCINNGLIGTLRKLDNTFALFKSRSTKTYYPMDIGKIKSIELY